MAVNETNPAVAKRPFDVLVVGELNVDLILNQLQTFPELGKEVLAKKMLLTLGSSSAIFASNLSVLGTRVRFCGLVGKDVFADRIINDLSSKGVDTEYILKSETSETGISVALNVEEDRAMVTYPGAMEQLTAAEVTNEILRTASHLHVSSVFLQPGLKPGLPSLFKRAHELGLTTSFDPQWDPAEAWELYLENLLRHVDVFLPNREELKNITGKATLEECRKSLKGKTCMTVVKKGNEGAILFSADEIMEQPAFLNTEVVDAIGAGDSFNAGFIHGFVHHKTKKECLQFGALCGAINTTASGGTTAFQNYDTVKRVATGKFNFQL